MLGQDTFRYKYSCEATFFTRQTNRQTTSGLDSTAIVGLAKHPGCIHDQDICMKLSRYK